MRDCLRPRRLIWGFEVGGIDCPQTEPAETSLQGTPDMMLLMSLKLCGVEGVLGWLVGR